VQNETSGEVIVPFNTVLLGWVIENLVKNSADAMREAAASPKAHRDRNGGIIDVEDTGKGVPERISRQSSNPDIPPGREDGAWACHSPKELWKSIIRKDICIALRNRDMDAACASYLGNRGNNLKKQGYSLNQ
jgi:hypothetical protein